MSNPTNIPAFRPTAFDTVAKNFWQDYMQGNPIGGGTAYENKLRECRLDGSLDSLKQLDRLLLAIKKDLHKRNYDEKLVLQQNSFRNLLLFIMFYAGKVASHELKETGSWQPVAHMEQYYPNVAFGVGENKFYYLSAFFPQSFLNNTRIPPLFVLLSLGARLFGGFERKFTEPLTGELVSESLYWAVAGYVHIVGSLRSASVPQATQATQGQGIPSKIAQTAPRPLGKNPPQAPPTTMGHFDEQEYSGIPRQLLGQLPTPKSANASSQAQLQQEHLLRQEQARQEQLRQAQLRQEQARQEQLKQAQLQEQLRQEQLRQERLRQEQLKQAQLQEQLRQEQLRLEQLREQNPNTPLTAHQLAEQQALHRPRPQKGAVNLHLQASPPRNPAPPPMPLHKQHRFQAGGLAPMSLAPPVVTVKPKPSVAKPNISKPEPSLPKQQATAPTPKPQSASTTPAPQQGQGQIIAPKTPELTTKLDIEPEHLSVQSQSQNSTQGNLQNQPQNAPAVQPETKAEAKKPTPPTAPKADKLSKPANESLFAELYQDLINLPPANTRADAEYQKAKAVLDRYDATIAERVAKGQTMISFTETELNELQRTVEFVKRMANGGNTNAMIGYALCCFKGVAMPQDMEQGAVWITKASDANDIRAQKFLSRLYYQGVGVEQSIRQGEYWLERAAKNGHPEAKKVQSQFAKVKTMKEDYQNEAQKDKRYAVIFIVLGLFVALAFWLLSAFV